MIRRTSKAWLYLLPALLFLGFFMVYPLFDVFVYSVEEGYNSASQTYFGTGLYNYSYVLHDPYFLQAVKNTFIIVIITVPLSTAFALAISLALSSVKKLKELYQTVFFLPYVTNTLAVGLVFMILFKKTAYTDGMVNLLIQLFGGKSVDFIDGPYWAKMFVMCFYTIWVVMPFKILILTSALASVNQDCQLNRFRSSEGKHCFNCCPYGTSGKQYIINQNNRIIRKRHRYTATGRFRCFADFSQIIPVK